MAGGIRAARRFSFLHTDKIRTSNGLMAARSASAPYQAEVGRARSLSGPKGGRLALPRRTGNGRDTDGWRRARRARPTRPKLVGPARRAGRKAVSSPYRDGQATDRTRADGGALGERALPRTCTIWGESWILVFWKRRAGEIATLRFCHKAAAGKMGRPVAGGG